MGVWQAPAVEEGGKDREGVRGVGGCECGCGWRAIENG